MGKQQSYQEAVLAHKKAQAALLNIEVGSGALIRAAKAFKYLLDIQPPDALFHPNGGDARNSVCYREASRLLEQWCDGCHLVED